MKSNELEKTLDVPPKELWTSVFFHDEYKEGLYHALKIHVFDVNIVKEGEWPNLKVKRTQTFEPDRNIPKALLKLVRGAVQVKEIAEFDSEKRKLSVQLIVPVVGDRVDYRYSYSWDDRGDNKLHVRWRGECDAKVPLIRGLAENFLIKELTESVRMADEFAQRWFSSTTGD